DTSKTVAVATVREPDTTKLAGIWYLQPVLASDTAAGKTPFLRFDVAKTRVSGNTGCNSLNGAFWYSDKDSSLTFNEKFVTTRMACPGYNEQAFLKSLMNANHYRLHKGTLILMTDQTELSRWARKPAVAPKSGKA
ncbi:MAG TPA: META domain-containing protein, partial [Puia sp.]|nr:META domain-containing protein [Puia sp.]